MLEKSWHRQNRWLESQEALAITSAQIRTKKRKNPKNLQHQTRKTVKILKKVKSCTENPKFFQILSTIQKFSERSQKTHRHVPVRFVLYQTRTVPMNVPMNLSPTKLSARPELIRTVFGPMDQLRWNRACAPFEALRPCFKKLWKSFFKTAFRESQKKPA